MCSRCRRASASADHATRAHVRHPRHRRVSLLLWWRRRRRARRRASVGSGRRRRARGGRLDLPRERPRQVRRARGPRRGQQGRGRRRRRLAAARVRGGRARVRRALQVGRAEQRRRRPVRARERRVGRGQDRDDQAAAPGRWKSNQIKSNQIKSNQIKWTNDVDPSFSYTTRGEEWFPPVSRTTRESPPAPHTHTHTHTHTHIRRRRPPLTRAAALRALVPHAGAAGPRPAARGRCGRRGVAAALGPPPRVERQLAPRQPRAPGRAARRRRGRDREAHPRDEPDPRGAVEMTCRRRIRCLSTTKKVTVVRTTRPRSSRRSATRARCATTTRAASPSCCGCGTRRAAAAARRPRRRRRSRCAGVWVVWGTSPRGAPLSGSLACAASSHPHATLR